MLNPLLRSRGALLSCALLLSLLVTSPLHAEEPLRLAIQPIQSAETTATFYRPLAEYLAQTTGLEIRLVTTSNFLTYWTEIKQGKYDLVLDAAHFTDYRIREQGYIPLAKVPGEVSYSLVTHPDTFVFEPNELVGKPIASIASPSLGMVRLLELYPNPLRQPRIIEANSAEAIVDLIEKGSAVAGMIPTPLLNLHPELNVVMTTKPAPHVTFSASPQLTAADRAKIQRALLNAPKTAEGQAMLNAINFTDLVEADARIYSGYAELLNGTWGY